MNAVSLYARPSAEFAEKLNATVNLLRRAAFEHDGAIVQATSLGVEDMVLTDLIARHAIQIDIATLDTGALHEPTLALLPRIRQRYGLEVAVFQPAAASVIQFVARHGELAMRQSIELRKACCHLRKLEPLSRLLTRRTAWVTGQRREQSDARADVPASEVDDQGRIKFNPLADWTWGDVWHHVATHEVPYNPLHDQFYPSIGCAPCTRAIAVGEDSRSGRWWWENDSAKECGLHRPHSSGVQTPDGSRSESIGGVVPALAHIGHADVKDAPASGQSQSSTKECGLHVNKEKATA